MFALMVAEEGAINDRDLPTSAPYSHDPFHAPRGTDKNTPSASNIGICFPFSTRLQLWLQRCPLIEVHIEVEIEVGLGAAAQTLDHPWISRRQNPSDPLSIVSTSGRC